MRSKVFVLTYAISLVLCVLTAALWVRSYSNGDLIRYIGAESEAGSTSCFLSSTTGRIQLSCYVELGRDDTFQVAATGSRLPDGFSLRHWDSSAQPFTLPNDRFMNRIGFDARARELPLGSDYSVVIPYYALTLTTLAVGVFAYIRYRRLVRSRAVGRCAACGYDLRATPARCPECGKVTAASGAE
jgi:hypothetical protein